MQAGQNQLRPLVDDLIDSDLGVFFRAEYLKMGLMAAFQVPRAEQMLHQTDLLVLVQIVRVLYFVGQTELQDWTEFQQTQILTVGFQVVKVKLNQTDLVLPLLAQVVMALHLVGQTELQHSSELQFP